MYISYSGYKVYTECAKQYYLRYVTKPDVAPDNRVNMLFGSVVGTIFEQFYAQKVWRSPTVVDDLLAMAEPTLRATMVKEAEVGGVFRWKGQDFRSVYESKAELLTDIRAAIPRGVETIRLHGLVGQAAVEVKLNSEVAGQTLGGRADFILQRYGQPPSDVVILDGKGTRHHEKMDAKGVNRRATSVDVRQLYWYANLFRLKFRRYPTRLGFVFWQADPADAVDWVDVDVKKLQDFQTEVLDALRGIEERSSLKDLKVIYPANPAPEKCNLCSYLAICEEAQKALVVKSEEKKLRRGIPTGVTDLGLEGIGLDEC